MSTPLINQLRECADKDGSEAHARVMREAAAELKSLAEYKHLLQFLEKHPVTLVYDAKYDGWTYTTCVYRTVYGSPLAALRAYKRWVMEQDRLARRRTATVG